MEVNSIDRHAERTTAGFGMSTFTPAASVVRPLVVVALLVGVASCSGSSGGTLGEASSRSADVDVSTPTDPVSTGASSAVTFVDGAGGTPGEATITVVDGGIVDAVGSDGTTFTLAVPARAVDHDVTVTMTPLAGVRGITERGTVEAVRLEPEGLSFVEYAHLTIVPATPIAIEDQLMFWALGDGSSATPALMDPTTPDIVLMLEHFSGAGVAEVTSPERAAVLDQQASDARAKLQAQLVDEANAERAAVDAGHPDANRADLVGWLDEYERQVVQPLVAAASSSCAAATKAVDEALGVERQRNLMGVEGAHFDLVATLSLTDGPCEKEAKDQCKAAKDPSILVRFWLQQARMKELLGQESGIDLAHIVEKAKRICLPHSYTAQGGLEDFVGTGTICDLSKPFTISGSGVVQMFSPTSEEGGTYDYTGSGDGFTMQGSGTYVVTIADDGSGTIEATGSGSVSTELGVFAAEGTEVYTLTEIEQC